MVIMAVGNHIASLSTIIINHHYHHYQSLLTYQKFHHHYQPLCWQPYQPTERFAITAIFGLWWRDPPAIKLALLENPPVFLSRVHLIFPAINLHIAVKLHDSFGHVDTGGDGPSTTSHGRCIWWGGWGGWGDTSDQWLLLLSQPLFPTKKRTICVVVLKSFEWSCFMMICWLIRIYISIFFARMILVL